MNVLNAAVENYCELPRIMRKPLWQVWHKLLIRFDKEGAVNFMNYGYNHLRGEKRTFLYEEDEINRYCIQLYDRVVRGNDLKDKDILEVGSGRGGGASYVARYYSPKSYTGLDISTDLIDFCNTYYKTPGLRFIKGAAENQPFRDGAFDTVINIESARCYGNLNTFFREVYRVLKQGGQFLLADMIKKEDVILMHDRLQQEGFHIESTTNITENVINALGNDTHRRVNLITTLVPAFFRGAFFQFAGTTGTARYDSFVNGKYEYWVFSLNKIESIDSANVLA
jgi:ubiquinone/menaquinone biosynthesis C-methylase UbiE